MKKTCTLLVVGSLLTGCENVTEVAVRVVVPNDARDLERADNASTVLEPGGSPVTFAVDGLDFELQLEYEPDSSEHQLALYLAQGEELLAWGRTMGFFFNDGEEPALFLGRAGTLSNYPEALESPDSGTLAATAYNRGALLLDSDGATFLLNEHSWTVEVADTLADADSPAADDGGLFGLADGTVVRLGWAQGYVAYHYDPGSDQWRTLSIADADDLAPRPGAASMAIFGEDRVVLFGGGDNRDALAIRLDPTSDGELETEVVDDVELDNPRQGATALALVRSEAAAGVLLFGGDDPEAPLLFSTEHDAVGDLVGSRVDGKCRQADDGSGDEASVLCLGGRDENGDSPLDIIRIRLTDDTAQTDNVAELPLAMPDPAMLRDDVSVYAVGSSAVVRIDPSEYEVTVDETPALRSIGGSGALLNSGGTLLVGGEDADATPVDRWQIFVPDL